MFVENESYKHKAAKEVLKQWFKESMKQNSRGCACIGDIIFCSEVFLEYPICDNITVTTREVYHNEKGEQYFEEETTYNENSWERNWNVIRGTYDEYVPTYEECITIHKTYPIAIIDMVCSSIGNPNIGIEICHKNPVSSEKCEKLMEFGVHSLIEIDADWILNQTKIPDKLKYKRLI